MATAKPFRPIHHLCPQANELHPRQIPLAILSVGRDYQLLKQREYRIARQSNFPIRSLDPEQAEVHARSSRVRLWILCHTIELPKLMYLASSVRRYSPHSRLLCLESLGLPGFATALFHRTVSASIHPAGLLEILHQMAGSMTSTAATQQECLRSAGYNS